MNKFTHLKILVLVQLLAIILLIIAIIYPIESLLDPLLQEYLMKENIIDDNISMPLLLVYISLLLIPLSINLISLATLLFKKAWAKKAYVFTTLILLPISFFLGTEISHPIEAGLNDILMFSSGMLVALIMYTDVYEEE